MEAKYEEESEAVQRDLNGKQTDLMSKIKRAEDNLAQMTRQQTDMMEQTRSEVCFVCFTSFYLYFITTCFFAVICLSYVSHFSLFSERIN